MRRGGAGTRAASGASKFGCERHDTKQRRDRLRMRGPGATDSKMIAGNDWELVARAHGSSGAAERARLYPGILALKPHVHCGAGDPKNPCSAHSNVWPSKVVLCSCAFQVLRKRLTSSATDLPNLRQHTSQPRRSCNRPRVKGHGPATVTSHPASPRTTRANFLNRSNNLA